MVITNMGYALDRINRPNYEYQHFLNFTQIRQKPSVNFRDESGRFEKCSLQFFTPKYTAVWDPTCLIAAQTKMADSLSDNTIYGH